MTLTTFAQPRRRREVGAAAGLATGLALAIGVLGLAVGALWWAVAPRIEIVRTQAGYGLTAKSVYLDQLESPVGAEGSFLFVALGAGAVLAVLAWLVLRRQRGAVVLVGLALGSLLGAWLAWRFGVWLDLRRFQTAAATTPVGGHLDAPLSLHIDRYFGLDVTRTTPAGLTGVVAVQPLVAAIVYTMLASFAADAGLRPRSQWSRDGSGDGYDGAAPHGLPQGAAPEAVRPSWDSAETTDRPDRPAPPADG